MGQTQVFNCKGCGGQVEVRAPGASVSVICKSCGSVADPNDENFKIIGKLNNARKVVPTIPIGSRGKLHGHQWECIGFMERCDQSGMYSWMEYLLFNPAKGFRWLMEFDGHWNYILTTKQRPAILAGNIADYLGQHYQLFHKGTASVRHVEGEFYWVVQKGETVSVRDFIRPPEILSEEKNGSELIWSIGTYITPREVSAAFGVGKMPPEVGVAPNQPSALSESWGKIQGYTAAFLSVIVFLQLSHVAFAKRKPVYNQVISYAGQNSPEIATPSFKLEGGLANVEFDLHAPVTNDWFELEMSLVNDADGEAYEVEHGVEWYSGVDSDGSWSEGNTRDQKVLSSVPAGQYHLQIKPKGGGSMILHNSNYQLTVSRDVPTWSNFWLAVGLLLFAPLIIWWRQRAFEVNRWSTSDYSPYYQEDS